MARARVEAISNTKVMLGLVDLEVRLGLGLGLEPGLGVGLRL